MRLTKNSAEKAFTRRRKGECTEDDANHYGIKKSDENGFHAKTLRYTKT